MNSEILAKAFHKAGAEIKLLTWSEDPGEKPFPFPIIRNPGVLTIIKAHRWADIVFENNPSLRLAWPLIFSNKPSVVALRTWVTRIDGRIGWQDKLKIFWLRRAKAVIAVSEAVRTRCWPSAIVIGNPYRIDIFRVLSNILRTSDFVFLGRLVSDKGADLAIQAFHDMLNIRKQEGVNIDTLSLTIIGDGPEEKNLKHMVLNLGIHDKVHFTGSLQGEALVACLNRHRFLLAPSRWEEPFGNVVLEGMACGCIPIVSDGGGLPDAVGKAGIIFNRGDLDALVACMNLVLKDHALEQQFKIAAQVHLVSHHPDVVSKRYLDVIEAAMGYAQVI